MSTSPVDGIDGRPGRLGGERGDDGLGGTRADARHFRDIFLDRRRAQPLERTELRQQRLAPRFAEPGNVVERALDHGLGTLLPVIGDREPVGLVADALQQVEPFAAARQDQRVGVTRHPDLLQPLGQPAR